MAKLTEAQAQPSWAPTSGSSGRSSPTARPRRASSGSDYDGENVVFNTRRPRAKGRHLSRDPRVSISVFDHNDPYRYLEIEGKAVLEDEGADEHIHKLSRKYKGHDYADPTGRVIVRVRPERVHSMGFD